MSTERVSTFIDRHLLLLSQERDAEVERTSLVFSKCGPKLLEQKGLALNGLGIASIGVGLGNKTCVHMRYPPSTDRTTLRKAGSSNWNVRLHTIRSLFFLHIHFGARPFRILFSSPNPGISPGDLASIEENVVSTGRTKKSTKPMSASAGDNEKSVIEGVVYKVCATNLFFSRLISFEGFGLPHNYRH